MQNLEQMFDVIRSLKMDYGENFFSSLTSHLHQMIGADYTFIARLEPSRSVSQTVAFYTKQGRQDNFEYDLMHTPCADVSHDTICMYPAKICDIYPKDQLLIDMHINGYIGVPLHASTGKVVGLIVGLYEQQVQNPETVVDTFRFFEGRISAELERTNMFNELKVLNTELEDMVDARTQELQSALTSLEQTQQQMVEQEKQASLGRLVSGLAHEINTPLGVAILASTTLEANVDELNSGLSDNQLTKTKVQRYCKDIQEAASIVNFNLNRAAELVVNFKQISNDQTSDELVSLDLAGWLPNVVASLSPLAKKNGVLLKSEDIDASCLCTTYPAKLYQVINNLVSNAIKHGFEGIDSDANNVCILSCNSTSDNSVKLTVSDNGNGIDEETLRHIYEPFFTTKRGQGGTGLGMSIVFSTVNGPLEGKVSIDTIKGKGTSVIVELPSSLVTHH